MDGTVTVPAMLAALPLWVAMLRVWKVRYDLRINALFNGIPEGRRDMLSPLALANATRCT